MPLTMVLWRSYLNKADGNRIRAWPSLIRRLGIVDLHSSSGQTSQMLLLRTSEVEVETILASARLIKLEL